MKKVMMLILVIATCWSCDTANAPDCIQASGDIISIELDVDAFDKVVVYNRVQLKVQQGTTQQVFLESGENLIDDVQVEVVDGQLILKNHNNCNLVRDYGLTVVTVITPDLTEIRSSTGLETQSIGILDFDSLTLFSEGFQNDFQSSGDFRMTLDVDNLRIVNNNISNYYLNGVVQNANLEWYSGDGQLIARDLEIQNAQIFHRGTNNWQIDVKQNITGTLSGYGDVILETAPVNINVDEIWDGRLIIRN